MTEKTRGSSPVSVDGERTSPTGVRVSTMGWLSFLTMFAIGTDTFLVAPLLPLLRRELDVPPVPGRLAGLGLRPGVRAVRPRGRPRL